MVIITGLCVRLRIGKELLATLVLSAIMTDMPMVMSAAQNQRIKKHLLLVIERTERESQIAHMNALVEATKKRRKVRITCNKAM